MRQIAANAGYEGSVVVESVRRQQAETGNKNIGFDVVTRGLRRHGRGRASSTRPR